jgi:hypothetical protein
VADGHPADSRGTVTANTYLQLETKTWAAIQKWQALCITARWFVCTSNRPYHRDAKETWFCSPATCKEGNSEAFAGQHAADASSFYIFDEASAAPDKIFELAEGGLSDGHPFIFLFGNATRNSGKLYRVCFGSEQDGWVHKSIDSRACALTNKELIAEWIATYGEDSDFVRVRVRGLRPAAEELQFIDRLRIFEAQRREPESLHDDPLVVGVDVSEPAPMLRALRNRRHSFRKATSGSTLAARAAGRYPAASAVSANTIAAPASTAVSCGATPNSSDFASFANGK